MHDKESSLLFRPVQMRYARMPFTPYKSAFDPETLQILQAAFDMAWSEVADTPGVMVDQEAARNVIARRIVDVWRDKSERDPERLKSYAIQGIAP